MRKGGRQRLGREDRKEKGPVKNVTVGVGTRGKRDRVGREVLTLTST